MESSVKDLVIFSSALVLGVAIAHKVQKSSNHVKRAKDIENNCSKKRVYIRKYTKIN